MKEIETIRAQFPILGRAIYNKPLVYLDNGATTQKPLRVIRKIDEGYSLHNANIHRGVHFLSQEATTRHEEARETVCRFLNAAHSSEVIFTRGTTESINLVAATLPSLFNRGDEVLISEMEHHSNIVPWQLAAERFGLVLKVIPILDNGELDMQAFASLLSERTRLVSVTHISNVLGTINPIREIIAAAHAHGALVLIDGAQAVAHTPIDVQALDVDFYVFSGHKVYAPNGIGVLYGKTQWLNAMPPYQGGGEMIAQVTFEKTTYNELPFKFEAGTPDYIGSTALAEALNFVTETGIEQIAEHETRLTEYATRLLSEIPGFRLIGDAAHKSGVISFLIGEIHPYDMGMLLDKMGIAVRTGHHCAQPLMKRFGIEGTVRCSFAVYNTFEEVDQLVAAVKKATAMLS